MIQEVRGTDTGYNWVREQFLAGCLRPLEVLAQPGQRALCKNASLAFSPVTISATRNQAPNPVFLLGLQQTSTCPLKRVPITEADQDWAEISNSSQSLPKV